MRSYKLLNKHNRRAAGSIMCSTTPMIGSKLIYATTHSAAHFRVVDVEYTFYDDVEAYDIEIVVEPIDLQG